MPICTARGSVYSTSKDFKIDAIKVIRSIAACDVQDRLKIWPPGELAHVTASDCVYYMMQRCM